MVRERVFCWHAMLTTDSSFSPPFFFLSFFPVIVSTPGKVVKHEDVQTIQGQGMPMYGEPYQFGRMLYVKTMSYGIHGT